MDDEDALLGDFLMTSRPWILIADEPGGRYNASQVATILAGGFRAVPLFTDDDLAERFTQSPQVASVETRKLKPIRVQTWALGADLLIDLRDNFGASYVTLDPGAQRVNRYDIDQAIALFRSNDPG